METILETKPILKFSIPERYKNNPKTYSEKGGNLNIGSQEEDVWVRILSNFAPTPFELDGIRYESVEGFIQSLKEPDFSKQYEIAGMLGREAKKAGRNYKSLISESFSKEEGEGEPVGYVINYQDIQIPYGSEEHYSLIERAIRAKFEQNKKATDALIGENANERRKITHVLKRNDGSIINENPTTSLPVEVFTAILMNIRHKEQMKIWKVRAKRGDITFDLRRFFREELEAGNLDILSLQKLGYETTLISWLKSLTPKGMKYGTAGEEERLKEVQKYAELAGVDDLRAFAKEHGLAK